MEIGSLIIFVAILIFAAHFFAWIFSHTKIPDALLLMCVGLLAGPILGLIPYSYFGEAAELVVMLVLVIVLLGTSLLIFAVHRTEFRYSYASFLKKFS